MVAQAVSGFKTSTILVYMILNGKGDLTGCGLHGDSLASIVLTGQSNIAGCFINKTFLLASSVFGGIFWFFFTLYFIW